MEGLDNLLSLTVPSWSASMRRWPALRTWSSNGFCSKWRCSSRSVLHDSDSSSRCSICSRCSLTTRRASSYWECQFESNFRFLMVVEFYEGKGGGREWSGQAFGIFKSVKTHETFLYLYFVSRLHINHVSTSINCQRSCDVWREGDYFHIKATLG